MPRAPAVLGSVFADSGQTSSSWIASVVETTPRRSESSMTRQEQQLSEALRRSGSLHVEANLPPTCAAASAPPPAFRHGPGTPGGRRPFPAASRPPSTRRNGSIPGSRIRDPAFSFWAGFIVQPVNDAKPRCTALFSRIAYSPCGRGTLKMNDNTPSARYDLQGLRLIRAQAE